MSLPENLDITAYETLGRYFLWSQTMGELYAQDVALISGIPDFLATLGERTDEDLDLLVRRMTAEQSERNLGLLSYWYASLYVVIEGWRELKLEDQDISRLLASPYVETLRRYRNGAFHFQRTLTDPRFADFHVVGGVEITMWMAELRTHLSRFLLENSRAAIAARGA
jgi:hypothetical protein